jgi:COMPASS component SWD3
MNNPIQPKDNDAVLGGQAPPTGAVLGGLAGIRQRFAHITIEQQIAILSEAINYGQPGLELVIQVLLGAEFANSLQLQQAAYGLLRDRPESSVQAALRAYNPYPYFKCLATYPYTGDWLIYRKDSFVRSVVLSPDGQTLIARGDSTLQAWNLKTGKIMATLAFPISSDDISDAITELYPHSKFWSIRNGETEFHSGSYGSDFHLAFFPDGQTVASCGNNYMIRLWNRHTGELIDALVDHAIQVSAVAISPDGQTLVSGGNDKLIKIWNVPNRQVVRTLRSHTQPISALVISSDGETFISASGDRTIRGWNLQTGEERYTLRGHTDSVSTIAISPDGKTLVSGSADKTVKVWNLQTGQEIQTFTGHTHYILAVSISHDKQRLISGSRDGTIKVWGMPST